MKTQHTPGPWIADIRSGCFVVDTIKHHCLAGASPTAIVYQSGRGEKSSAGGYKYVTEEQAANARLIAAAPDLLEALEEMYQICNYSSDNAPHKQKALAALKKAKGEA